LSAGVATAASVAGQQTADAIASGSHQLRKVAPKAAAAAGKTAAKPFKSAPPAFMNKSATKKRAVKTTVSSGARRGEKKS
jgi:hypothetical protein